MAQPDAYYEDWQLAKIDSLDDILAIGAFIAGPAAWLGVVLWAVKQAQGF